jgi:putative alpha-1,2-mannosidase
LYAQQNSLVFVDPLIGSSKSSVFTKWGSEGGTYPGAVAPSGYIQLTPETRVLKTKGYDFRDSTIYFFSCLHHNSGFPNGSAGRLFIMPVEVSQKFNLYRYNRTFTHRNEIAQAGYYSVLFPDNNTLVETTASERAGIFRITFPAHVVPQIFIGDAGDISSNSDTIIHGTNFNAVIQLSKGYTSKQEVDGGWLINFTASETGTTVITLTISASTVSVESAQRNIEVEVGERGFDNLRQRTQTSWTKALSVISIDDDDQEKKKIFYTALYHSMLIPWIVSDVDGNYRGADGKVYKASGRRQYGNFSPWDTFRSLNPLLTLLFPGKENDIVLSMLDIYRQTGYLPVESMTGNHAVPIIVDSYLKGITGFDSALAYTAMRKSIVDPPFIQQDMQVYQTLGFIPFSLPESVTRTVEYAYDDWALANYSKAVMHNNDDYNLLLKRSYNYRNLFNVDDLLLLPRNKNEFKMQPGTSGYKEGDKWVYSWFVPHNTRDLINLMGGNKAFADRLDSALTSNAIVFDNETVFHIPYLFNDAGEPGKTQRWLRNLRATRFAATPGGLPGNDDLGSMSSWYVFSALGIYPMCPGRPLYAVGSPLFNAVTMHLENGKKFTIKSKNASNENIYVKSIVLNGEVYNKLIIPHSSLLQGGEMNFIMDRISNKNWQKNNSYIGWSETTNDASFSIVNYSVSKNKVKPNELLWVYFTVKNNGSLGTKRISLFVNNKLYGYKNCMIPANAAITDSIGCRLYSYGKSTIKIESVIGKTVEVMKLDNGIAASLKVSALLVKPIIKDNEEQIISFNVQNISGVERRFKIPVLLNDSLIQVHNILLEPGEIATVSQTVSVTKNGFHSISINGLRKIFKVYDTNKDAIVLDLDMKHSKSDSVIDDRSGFGNDGRIIRTDGISDTLHAGGLLLGKNCFIEIPNSGSLDMLKVSITMMAWIYPTGENNGLVDLFTKGDSHVLQTSGNKTLTFFAGGWGRGDCSVELPANWKNSWHHIAGVCDGKSLKIYIDGKLTGTTQLEDSVNLSIVNKWNLGRNEEFPSERIFSGYMDDVKVFIEPLSASEIVFEMNHK